MMRESRESLAEELLLVVVLGNWLFRCVVVSSSGLVDRAVLSPLEVVVSESVVEMLVL